MQSATGEKLLDTLRHDGTQRTRARLEALLVSMEIAVEVVLEYLIKDGALGMARTINSRGIPNPSARIRRAAMRVVGWNLLGESKQQRTESHGSPPAAEDPQNLPQSLSVSYSPGTI